MTKEQVLKAFESVIQSLAQEAEKATSLNTYLKIQGRMEAYQDSINLISKYFEEAEKGAETATAAEPITEEEVAHVVEKSAPAAAKKTK